MKVYIIMKVNNTIQNMYIAIAILCFTDSVNLVQVPTLKKGRGKWVNTERTVNTEHAIMSNIHVQTGMGSLLY